MSAGVVYLALGLLLGRSLPSVLLVVAPGALAGMLLFVAIQHGRLAAQLDRLPDRLIAAGVGAVTILTGNLALGFAAGIAALVAGGAWRRVTSAAGSLARA